MTSDLQTKNEMLVGTDTDSLNRDCRQLRQFSKTELPTADEVIDFLDGYNSFINHATRPFSPMIEKTILL